MKKSRSQPKPPLNLRISSIIAGILAVLSVAVASFVAGYSLAFFRLADLYTQTSVLKAKAAELEDQILHLKNYAVLIDAIAAQGKAANELQKLPQAALASDTLHGGNDERD